MHVPCGLVLSLTLKHLHGGLDGSTGLIKGSLGLDNGLSAENFTGTCLQYFKIDMSNKRAIQYVITIINLSAIKILIVKIWQIHSHLPNSTKFLSMWCVTQMFYLA